MLGSVEADGFTLGCELGIEDMEGCADTDGNSLGDNDGALENDGLSDGALDGSCDTLGLSEDWIEGAWLVEGGMEGMNEG